jgi:diadenosine tetraphosphate (Ap4A) HIT family hydrolase
VAAYFALYQPELNAVHSLLMEIKAMIASQDKGISGFNVGVNEGAAAGQTIFHCHVHLIPPAMVRLRTPGVASEV